MDKHAVALVLDEIGTLLELQGEDNQFRSRAFYNAARALDSVAGDIARLALSGELREVPGFGPVTADVVRELVLTGGSSFHRDLRERTPAGLFELLAVPGLGTRKIHVLHERLGVTSLDELERAAAAGRVAALPGFGVRTQEKLVEGVAFVRSIAGRRRQPEALTVAGWLLGFLRGRPDVRRVEPAGELRRLAETIDGLDLIAATPAAGPVLRAFAELPSALRGEVTGGEAARARLADGLELRLRCVAPEAFAAAWAAATGGEAHFEALARRAGERGLRLDAEGLWRGEKRLPIEDEPALYEALGLAHVPPELREGRGELEAAAAGRLPRLIEQADLRGCFHCHTTYSDGKASLTEMAEAARARGWRYLGIADHSQAAYYAGGLKPDRIEEQHAEIDAWNAERGGELWLFKGVEADVLPDGRLDYADEPGDVLGRFDYVVASVHSNFGMAEAEMTRRVLRALEDPRLTMLGHPTGRLLLSRRSYRIDLDAVIAAAGERGVAIEINSNPRRLELDWRYWQRARALGVRTAINPDAHSTAELGLVQYGVNIARKGWLGVGDVINAWSIEDVREFFSRGRAS